MQSHMAILIAYCIGMKKNHQILLNFAILAKKWQKRTFSYKVACKKISWSGQRGGHRTVPPLNTPLLECGLFLESIKSACQYSGGTRYWSAGHRMSHSPTAGSTFVWRVPSGDTYVSSTMTYSNWGQGEPNYLTEGCLQVIGDDPYTWNDNHCEAQLCPVCELDKGV